MKTTARNRVIFGTFVFVALLIRLIYLIETSRTFVGQLIVCDSVFYLAQTADVLDGDIAPNEAFRLSPLYPYLLAAGFFISGVTEPYVVKLWQALLGAITCGMTYLLAARLFGNKAGIAAGILYLLYGPLVFADGLILLESSMCFFHLLFLILLVATFERRTPVLAGLTGLVLSLTALSRGNVLLYVPAIVIFALWRPHDGRRRAALRVVLPLLTGLALPLALCALANYAAEKDLVLVSSNAGYNFFVGNRPEASGVYDRITRYGETAWFKTTDPDGRDFARAVTGENLSPSQASRFWFKTTLESMKGRYGATLLLFLKKIGLFFNRHELPQIYWYGLAEDESAVLKCLPLSFAILTPLGLFGLGLAFAMRGSHRLLAMLAVLYVLSIAVFFVVDRYRIPLVPLLLVFSGAAAAWWIDRLRAHGFAKLARPAIALAVLAVPPFLPIQVHKTAVVYATYAAHCLGTGQLSDAAAFAQKANQLAPQESLPLYVLGRVAHAQGDVSLAIDRYHKAIGAKDPQPVYFAALATALRSKSDLDGARDALEAGLNTTPDDLECLILLGQVNEQRADLVGARAAYEKAIAAQPKSSFVLFSLGKLEAASGEIEQARRHLTEAARLSPNIPDIRRALDALEEPAHGSG